MVLSQNNRLLHINQGNKNEDDGNDISELPSDRQPHLSLCKDSMEVNKAEAVALCRGIKDCKLANSTGSLKMHHNNLLFHNMFVNLTKTDKTNKIFQIKLTHSGLPN